MDKTQVFQLRTSSKGGVNDWTIAKMSRNWSCDTFIEGNIINNDMFS